MDYRGPGIESKIKKELKELLIKDGVKNYSEIIGKKQRHSRINLTRSTSHFIQSILLCQKNVNSPEKFL